MVLGVGGGFMEINGIKFTAEVYQATTSKILRLREGVGRTSGVYRYLVYRGNKKRTGCQLLLRR